MPAAQRPPEPSNQKGLVLAVGRRVDVHGLKGAAQYNGSEGRIFSGPNEKGRWEVQINYQCEDKTLSLAAENLQPKPSCGWELIVAPIGFGIVEADVAEALSKLARARSVNMTRDEKGVPKGVCLVEMPLKTDAEEVLKHSHGLLLKGREVKIDWSTKTKMEMGLLKTRGEDDPEVGLEPRSFKESSQHVAFQVGQAVVLSGLKGAAQFNGSIGLIVNVRGDERYEVEIDQESGDKKVLALKPENLSLARDEKSAEKAEEKSEVTAEARPSESHGSGPPESQETGDGTGAEPRKRRRPSAWNEANSGGDGPAVVDPSSLKGLLEKRAKAESNSEAVSSPLPSEAELATLPVKELRRLLIANGVDTIGCLEKTELLEQARQHIASRSTSE